MLSGTTLVDDTDLTGTPLEGLEAEVDSLRETGNLLWQRGWSVGTSSNYSVVSKRKPLELLLTASGMDKGRLARRDFVRVNRKGEPVVPGQPKSSAETMLHVAAVSAMPEIGCVLHTHSIWATILSDMYFEQSGFELEGYEMLKGLEGVKTHEHSEWVHVFDNTQDIPVLAKEVKRAFKAKKRPLVHGYLIRRHGLYTWGKTVAEARRHIEIYEFLFEVHARRLMAAGVTFPTTRLLDGVG